MAAEIINCFYASKRPCLKKKEVKIKKLGGLLAATSLIQHVDETSENTHIIA